MSPTETVIPIFRTERLVVRPLIESDAPAYQKHFADYNVIRTLTRLVPWPYPAAGALDYIRTVILPNQGKDRWTWGITLKEAPEEVIGAVEMWRYGQIDNRGFWLAHKHWGKGFMTEAVFPVTDYAFDTLGFEKLVFSNAVGNKRSGRVKEKSGARLIKEIPGEFVDPALTTSEIYELTKEEWQKMRRSQL